MFDFFKFLPNILYTLLFSKHHSFSRTPGISILKIHKKVNIGGFIKLSLKMFILDSLRSDPQSHKVSQKNITCNKKWMFFFFTVFWKYKNCFEIYTTSYKNDYSENNLKRYKNVFFNMCTHYKCFIPLHLKSYIWKPVPSNFQLYWRKVVIWFPIITLKVIIHKAINCFKFYNSKNHQIAETRPF